MTTLTPVKKTMEFKTQNVDEVYELTKEALRTSSVKSVSIYKSTVEEPSTWEVTIQYNYEKA